ncbi:oocyte zinc finger protein XlCOF6-like [Littorina saxatilis]|uniref:oocyte zinc finger protein XlCOF6-like n=1 Tax=Littorina saxatilis TaxID=31220 RepID=UPI0038B5663F
MDESEPGVKFEEDGQLVCCVCDATRSYLNTNYVCSKNCHKLFVFTQGLVLGSILQTLFGGLVELKVSKERENDSRKYEGTNSINVPLPELETHLDLSSHTEKESYRRSLRNQPLSAEPQVLMYVEPMNNSLASDHDNASDKSEFTEPVESKPLRLKRLKSVKHTTRLKNSHNRMKRTVKPTEGRISSQRKRSRFPCASKKNRTKPAPPVSEDDTDVTEDSCGESPKEKEQEELSASDMKNGMVEKQRVTCKRCGKMISKSHLYVHYRAMHKDNLSDVSALSVACSECGKMFMKKQALNAHKLKCHNHKFTNTCSHCGKGFASLFGLSWHMRQVHKVTVRQCGDCGETFKNRRDYKKHRRYKHTANSHVCHICGKGFKLKNALQAHLDAHAGVKLHFCEICGDGFVRFSSLCQHRNNLHGPKKSELPFKCHLCPNTFRLQAWLDRHIVQKHSSGVGEISQDCEMCQSLAITSVPCPLHGGSAKDTFPCPQCDKVFAKDTNLKVHMKQHQEPKFSCDICHKKFTYKCNMMRHRDTHSTEKQFHCDICAKQFCTKFLLASHMRMHNQDLMFKCEICGKGLTRKDYLKNHIKKMHPSYAQCQSSDVVAGSNTVT